MGPPGRDVEAHFGVADVSETIAGVLERLCGPEEIVPQDIVILSSHGYENSEVFARGRLGRFRLAKQRGALGQSVYFSSIRGFKGLESPVVVLCELDNLDEASRDNQIYVGMSRARNHCVIVAPQ